LAPLPKSVPAGDRWGKREGRAGVGFARASRNKNTHAALASQPSLALQ
jgi:hypothetical protein